MVYGGGVLVPERIMIMIVVVGHYFGEALLSAIFHLLVFIYFDARVTVMYLV